MDKLQSILEPLNAKSYSIADLALTVAFVAFLVGIGYIKGYRDGYIDK